MSLAMEIEKTTKAALAFLAEVVTCENVTAPTHECLMVSGWNRDKKTRRAVAHYLVGLRMSAMDSALNIKADLDDTEADRIEVLDNVLAIVGRDNSEDTEDKRNHKTYDRNPWIAEGIWHLCLALAKYRHPSLHPPGTILALNYPHPLTKDHGLDVAAIYETADFVGLSLVESKAHRDDVNGAINEAVQYFREVNEGKKHAARIRQSVQIMRQSLTAEVDIRITKSFWKRSRAYLPNPNYDSSVVVDWTNSRPSLPSLLVDGQTIHICVMPHPIDGFDEFFDQIADEMRAFARSLQYVR